MRSNVEIDRDPWGPLVQSGTLTAAASGAAGEGGSASPRLTVVVGAAGGVGATTVACGLCLAIAAQGRPVALVELDLARGDIAGAWDVPPERTIDDLAGVVDELGPGHVRLVAHRYSSNVSLLLSPRRAGAEGDWDGLATGRLLESAGELGSLVVDAGSSLGVHVEAACRRAGRVIVVVPPTVAGARRGRALVGTLERWCGGDRVLLAVNRGVGRPQLGDRGFAQAVGLPIGADLPRSDREAEELGAGRWTARRRRSLTRAIETIAQREGLA